jgi:DinB superfamily
MPSILTAIETTSFELLDTLDQVPAAQFLLSPPDGGWSPAQIAEHLLKSETNITRLLKHGQTVPTQRPADEHVKAIEGIFLDFDAKYETAAAIQPSDMPLKKEIVCKALQVNREDLLKIAEFTDLTLTYTDRKFPGLGTLTGLEWATVLVTHCQRHIRQLKNIT